MLGSRIGRALWLTSSRAALGLWERQELPGRQRPEAEKPPVLR